MPRKTGKLKTNKTFLLVVEGQTEKIYFSDMKSSDRIPGITIIPRNAKHSDLYTILSTAINEYASGAYDSVWCVFDRDTVIANGMTSKVQQKYEEAQKTGIHFADSLPAFEIWFLLHFEMPRNQYNNQEACIKDVRKHIPDYTKKQEWLIGAKLYATLKPKLETAKQNSMELEKRSKSSGSTTICHVYRLFDEIEKSITKR